MVNDEIKAILDEFKKDDRNTASEMIKDPNNPDKRIMKMYWAFSRVKEAVIKAYEMGELSASMSIDAHNTALNDMKELLGDDVEDIVFGSQQ